MTRYIDADALKESVHAHDYVLKDCLNSTDKGMFTMGIMQAIDEQPTVDAVPVRHGKWIHEVRYTIDSLHSYQQYRCSECGMTYITNTKYCPNCGARMVEDE